MICNLLICNLLIQYQCDNYPNKVVMFWGASDFLFACIYDKSESNEQIFLPNFYMGWAKPKEEVIKFW